MVKVELSPRLRFDFPIGIVAVSCSAGRSERPNFIAVCGVSHACIEPTMLGIALGHTRYRYEVILK
jgi:flavin reductase (DIM6/NTAB) family NADH-FMN oxidoreductase RutF